MTDKPLPVLSVKDARTYHGILWPRIEKGLEGYLDGLYNSHEALRARVAELEAKNEALGGEVLADIRKLKKELQAEFAAELKKREENSPGRVAARRILSEPYPDDSDNDHHWHRNHG